MLLLNQDEFLDVLLCLARYDIHMVAFASRKLRAAVDALPPNRCLLGLREVVLTKKWDCHLVAQRKYVRSEPTRPRTRLVGWIHGILPRFVPQPIRPCKLRIRPSSDDPKPLTRLSLSSFKLCPAFLSTIRNANVDYVRIDWSHIPRKLEQLLLQSATPRGRIQYISVHTDFQRVTPSAFEALPFLAAEVASLRLYCPANPTSQLTSAHQSEKLLRNCIDRGVYSLKLIQEDGLGKPQIPTGESSDVSEATILEFCFAPRKARPDRPTQVELWLDWIYLSPEFLSRFIQASESCDSDHVVKLLLRGANVGKQDWSQFHRQDSHFPGWDYIGDSMWTHEGKYAIRVVRSLQEGFFFAHRSTLFPVDEWYFDRLMFVIDELDAKKDLYYE